MRGVTAVLVLLLAACSTAGGDTTTTAPLAEPSTTTTTAPSTTTTEEPTTTTAVEKCTERDGVLRNRRGFVCPPHLITVDMVAVGGADTVIHRPGTYETRLFDPPLRFTRDEQFTTVGERVQSVVFDLPRNTAMEAFGGELPLELATLPGLQPVNRPDEWVWVEELETEEIEVGGYPATVTSFTANCLDEAAAANAGECFFNISAMSELAFLQFHGQRTAVITVDTPDPMTIVVEADGRVFDIYWTEVAQPILDSIEFLDD